MSPITLLSLTAPVQQSTNAEHAVDAVTTQTRDTVTRRRSRSLASLPDATQGLVAPMSLALVSTHGSSVAPPALKPMDTLRVGGATVREVHDINPRGVNDCMVIVRERPGDDSAFVAFNVGQDSLAQASELFRLGFGLDMLEGRSKQLIISHEAACAPLVQQILEAIYFKSVEANFETALEMRALIDYLSVNKAPNPVLRNLCGECDSIITVHLKKENAESVFRRAVATFNEDVQTRAIKFLDLNQEFRMRAANYDEEEIAALTANSALKFTEQEPESNVLDLLWRWSQAHAESADTASQAQLLRDTRLVANVRWVTVRDALIWESLERELLTDADVGRIMRARYLKTNNRLDPKEYRLFDAFIPPPRA